MKEKTQNPKKTTIEATLDVKFKKKALLETALTHRSFLNENRKIQQHNERLEYLGDAVLEFLISKFLFEHYPDKPEGELTSYRSATVKTETLAQAAIELDLGPNILMSKGEERTGGREKEYILANTFEAIVGAMYLDRGIKKCDEFLHRVLFHKVDLIVKNRLDIDPKTRFQELAQEIHKETPIYKLISEVGPDHSKTFKMSVMVGEKSFGEGEGPSKQKAEEAAARKALEKIQKENRTSKTRLTA